MHHESYGNEMDMAQPKERIDYRRPFPLSERRNAKEGGENALKRQDDMHEKNNRKRKNPLDRFNKEQKEEEGLDMNQ